MKYYGEDLSYIHDVGHSDYALKSASEILEILRQHDITNGLVVDLGCGSGWSAQALIKAGYHVFEIDWSEALIAIARTRVPQAKFHVGSFFQSTISACQAVISIGECLNYRFDDEYTYSALVELFQRVYDALAPGGVFIFDLAEPGQVAAGQITQGFREGEDWLVLVEKQEEPRTNTLTRRIITLRQMGDTYRRSDEMHYLQLYESTAIAADLEKIGFQTQVTRCYGSYQLPPAHTAFIAQKPHGFIDSLQLG